HQIRVHMAAIGHPIVGDATYGSCSDVWKRYGIGRTMLHAESLEIQHPGTDKRVSFKAPWPADFKRAVQALRASVAAVILLAAVTVPSVRAEDGAPAAAAAPASTPAPAPKKTPHHSASSGSGSLTAAIRSLRREVSNLSTDVDTLKQRVGAIEAGLDELGASRRLQELEKALSEINGKTVASSAATEETKTQMLDLMRKMKIQSDALDDLRDQLDRLQRSVIEQRGLQDNTSPAAPAPTPPDAGKRP
ncbi:MAG TPA: hypothetical protein VMU17_00135, partial [Elusimicrobiota bacterium]|nr:hypothetical protein [Elusimicrobiota bacterium]